MLLALILAIIFTPVHLQPSDHPWNILTKSNHRINRPPPAPDSLVAVAGLGGT
jgi:hypothetical protein